MIILIIYYEIYDVMPSILPKINRILKNEYSKKIGDLKFEIK